jgi:hypothetical protein
VSQMQDIYTEYTRMRQNGMDAKSVLNTMRTHIEALGKPQREELASSLRAWEARRSTSEHAAVQAQPQQPKVGSIKPLKPIQPVAPATERDVTLLACPHCGKPNQKQDMVCYACGQLLDTSKVSNETRNFNASDSGPLDSEYFGADSVMALRVRGSTDPYEMRPQKADHELIIGRSTTGSAMAPDIDLDKKQGADLGVSRLHLSIGYDEQNKVVLVSDLGSANGSFINGQRLLAKEVRVIRHGDELRLGKMVMIVSFRHPSETKQ